MENIDSVAGPEVTSEHIAESTHRSAMEGGDALPSRRRDVVTPKYDPSFDASKQASTNPASSGDAAEQKSRALGDAKNAKEAEEKAKKAVVDAELKKSADK